RSGTPSPRANGSRRSWLTVALSLARSKLECDAIGLPTFTRHTPVTFRSNYLAGRLVIPRAPQLICTCGHIWDCVSAAGYFCRKLRLGAIGPIKKKRESGSVDRPVVFYLPG